MNYRENKVGGTIYRSAIPDSLFDVRLNEDEALQRLVVDTEDALHRWAEKFEKLGDDEKDALIRREAEISWWLSEGKTIDIFSPLWVAPIPTAADVQDINNLERATRWAADAMDELPISRRLLCDAHYLAMQGNRYEKRYPGYFRTSPVWIGEKGKRLTDTGVFVPPVDSDMDEAFTDLERFIHYADDVHPLVSIALAHYQLETIHPFIDGNGRIGRMLSQLQLMYYGLTHQPALQLSEQLSRQSMNYYFMIEQTHHTADYSAWIRFYLLSVKNAAESL